MLLCLERRGSFVLPCGMKVAIFMGSSSDADAMKGAADVLQQFAVEYKVFTVSAHRSPALLDETVARVEREGTQVIIAGAGLSAALPGAIAARTTLPVIGVPLECVKLGVSNGLAGLDALLSIAQMPPKIPVATVGIGSSRNAGYLAVSILSLKDDALKAKLADFRQQLAASAQGALESVEL